MNMQHKKQEIFCYYQIPKKSEQQLPKHIKSYFEDARQSTTFGHKKHSSGKELPLGNVDRYPKL